MNVEPDLQWSRERLSPVLEIENQALMEKSLGVYSRDFRRRDLFLASLS